MSYRGIQWCALLGLCLCMTACSQHEYFPPTEGAADHSLDAWIAQDSAHRLCRYSRGAFPSWHLWHEYRDLLTPEETKAIAYVQNRLEKHVPKSVRPKMRAVAKFIAQNTICEPDTDAVFKQTDDKGNIQFTFKQAVPWVPNVPPVLVTPEMSPKAIEKAWLEAFEQHDNGQKHERTIQITLEPANAAQTQYWMRSNVFDSYAAPLQISDFWKKLETWRLDEALELLSIACVQTPKNCDELTHHFEAASDLQAHAAAEFQKNVELKLERLTSVSMTGNSRYTAVQVALTNHSDVEYRHILLKTDEVVPQFCELQAKRTRREDASLVLQPQQEVLAWCVLDAETPPHIQLDVVVMDGHEASVHVSGI